MLEDYKTAAAKRHRAALKQLNEVKERQRAEETRLLELKKETRAQENTRTKQLVFISLGFSSFAGPGFDHFNHLSETINKSLVAIATV